MLQYIKDMQDAGALATVAGGQPDNEEAYPEYNSGNFAVQIMPFWQTSRFTNYMSDLEGKIAIAAPPVFGDNDAVKTIGGGRTGTAVVNLLRMQTLQLKYSLTSNCLKTLTKKFGMY